MFFFSFNFTFCHAIFLSFNHATFHGNEHKMNMQLKEYLTQFQDTLNVWER